MDKGQRIDLGKVILAICICGYFLYCATTPTDWHFIDNVDLVIHEAGHTSLWFFGDLIRIMGGSLFQVVVPLVFAIYFYGKNNLYATNIILAWVGYNMVNVAVYINDAIDMQLPLLGGDSVIHDWNYILTATGLLEHTHNIASLVNGAGFTIISIALVFSIYYARKSSDMLGE